MLFEKTITNVLDTFTNWWHDKGFEILIVVSVVVILFMWFFNNNRSGKWSKSYYFSSEPVQSVKPIKKNNGKSSGETECRRVMETLFGRPFPTCRPDFLNNSVSFRNLELDCYNDDLKLAVEYQGQQHYKYTPHFHRNKEAFDNQRYRDDMKRRMCMENGVKLLEVPYTVKPDKIEGYIKQMLLR